MAMRPWEDSHVFPKVSPKIHDDVVLEVLAA
jgi:hypothetical protein